MPVRSHECKLANTVYCAFFVTNLSIPDYAGLRVRLFTVFLQVTNSEAQMILGVISPGNIKQY